MKELSSPASGDVIAHKYKGLDAARELDSARTVTVAVVRGARAERPMVCTREGGEAGCVLRRSLNRRFHHSNRRE